MPKCPKCKEEITNLKAYSEIVQTYEVNENGNSECYGLDYIEGYIGFGCPECYKILFKEENKAIEFLKGVDTQIVLDKEKIKCGKQ